VGIYGSALDATNIVNGANSFGLGYDFSVHGVYNGLD
jgi:hypothetical protein